MFVPHRFQCICVPLSNIISWNLPWSLGRKKNQCSPDPRETFFVSKIPSIFFNCSLYQSNNCLDICSCVFYPINCFRFPQDLLIYLLVYCFGFFFFFFQTPPCSLENFGRSSPWFWKPLIRPQGFFSLKKLSTATFKPTLLSSFYFYKYCLFKITYYLSLLFRFSHHET